MEIHKKNITLILAGLFFFSVLAENVEARQPAVDPVRGLSIDEYQEVAPEEGEGFSFTERPQPVRREMASESPMTPRESISQLPSLDQSDLNTQSPQGLPTLILLLALLALPFGSWWLIHRKTGQTKLESHLPENTIDLQKHRNKEGDEDVSEAS